MPMANAVLQTITGALQAPASGETLIFSLPAGRDVAFAFNHESMLFDRSGEDLVIYTEGEPSGRLFLKGYFAAANADAAPDFILVDGTRISGGDFFAAMTFDPAKFVTEGGLQAADMAAIFPGDGAVLAASSGNCAAQPDMHCCAPTDTAALDEALAAMVRQGFM